VADAHAALAHVSPLVERARAMCALAIDARAGSATASNGALQRAVEEMMSWRHDARVRLLVQQTLGAAFLSRLWRLEVEPTLGHSAWRPLLLATHELVAQADALAGAIAIAKAA
jgi:hypothetical protein